MNYKKLLSVILSVILAAASMTVPLSSAVRAAAAVSDEQVVYAGGETANEGDGMVISKTATAVSGLENVFDICLRVQSKQSVAEIVSDPDAAIVVVMDISNTMNDIYDGSLTRYDAALAAIIAENNFLDKFTAQESKRSKIGFVAFNTSAHLIAPMQPCYDDDTKMALKETVTEKTGAIIHHYRTDDHTRFTNIEAGLAMAGDMLDSVTNQNKFIIFLSDGFPTTYMKANTKTYEGYEPYSSSGTKSAEGVFYNDLAKKLCTSGTSYSDTAAIRAREMATSIKEKGTEIYSVGIALGAQKISDFVDYIVDVAKGSYTGSAANFPYELGSASDPAAFENWLKNSIGSGHYTNSKNAQDLNNAFDDIFESIQIASEISESVWKVTDPMNAAQSDEHIDFLQFFEKDGTTLHTGALIGTSAEGAENTATFGSDSGAIDWDLKNSGYTVTHSGDDVYCTYELRYRVRLINEAADFLENQAISTNGTTTVTYKVYEETGSTVTISEDRKLEFKIPQVKGYLSDLKFVKTNSKTELPVAGAVFTLTHNDALCEVCKLAGVNRVAESLLTTPATAISDENGTVAFTGIPSGHIYTLQETAAPEHYLPSDKVYTVAVSYDSVTVKDGNTIWDTPFDVPNVRRNALTIEKQIAGDKTSADFEAESFLFQLKVGETVIDEVLLPKDDGSWVHTFDDLPDDTYTLTEQKLNDQPDGYSCITTYKVGDGDATSVCEITLIGGDEESVTVTNTYKKPDPARVTISATKVLEGKELADDMFQFQLVAVNDDGTEGNVLETVSNMADGSVTFAPLSYEEVGTYRYLVREVNGGKLIDRITYCGDLYGVTVTITKSEDGSLQSEAVITKDGKVAEMVFVNTYTAPQTPPTGDGFLPALCIAVFLSSALALAFCLTNRKRTNP